MKIPTNKIATSAIAPHVKWFLCLISFFVVLNERKAETSIKTISMIEGYDKTTSPIILKPATLPSAVWNAGSEGSIPLRITAVTMITRKIRL